MTIWVEVADNLAEVERRIECDLTDPEDLRGAIKYLVREVRLLRNAANAGKEQQVYFVKSIQP